MTLKSDPSHDRCDKCGQSLMMIHPWDQFNCHCPDESEKPMKTHSWSELRKTLPLWRRVRSWLRARGMLLKMWWNNQ